MFNRAPLSNRLLSLAIPFAAAILTVSCGGGIAQNTTTPKQNGTLGFNTSTLDFGKVTIGKSKDMSLTLLNSSPAGSSSITVTDVAANGTAFSIAPPNMPMTLAPGQSTIATVSFAPKSAGSTQGTISISLLGEGTPASVAVSGQGVTPGSLSSSPSSLGFGSVTVGSTSPLSLSLTNNGGTAVSISQASSSNGAFTLSGISLPASVAPSQSVSMTVTFAPSSAGSASGTLTLTSDAGNSPTTVALSGTGTTTPGTLNANPTTLSFGNVQVGSASSLSETVTNTGGSQVTISQATTGNGAFTISGLSLPAKVSAGKSLTFSVTFSPSAAGPVSGSLSLVSDASNSPASVTLSGAGTALGQFSVTPTTLNFGTIVVGANSSLTAGLKATGATVTVTSLSGTNAEFTVSGLTLPVSINAGQTVSFTVTFAPQATGTASTTLSFASNASNSPTQLPVTGNGTAPPQHRVDLSWIASTTQGVVGYNVYRSTTQGSGYSQINTVLNATTTYTDSQVSAGATYYYVATAVDGTGTQSSYSNEVKVTVPTP
jgi:hypothetical protein